MFIKNRQRKIKNLLLKTERTRNRRKWISDILLGLGTGIILVNLQSIGKYDKLKIALNMVVSNTVAFFRISL
jgi:hypothetical protein